MSDFDAGALKTGTDLFSRPPRSSGFNAEPDTTLDFINETVAAGQLIPGDGGSYLVVFFREGSIADKRLVAFSA